MKRRYRRRPARWITLALLLGLVAVGRISQRLFFPAGDSLVESPEGIDEGEYSVERVVDGDTLIVLVNGKRQRVRLLSIDTPEVFRKDGSGKLKKQAETFAEEASQFTKQFLAGNSVRLQFGRRRVDQYDRLLAYVFVADKMLNEELVRAGLAQAKIYPGDESALGTRIEKAEEHARQAKIGIWSSNRP